MDFSPLLYKVLRPLRGRASVAEVCDRTWELAGAQVTAAPPAVYLADQPAKVTACQENTDMQREMARVQGGPQEHGPTVAYQIRDALILDGALYRGRLRHELLERRYRPMAWGKAEEVGDAVLACTLFGNRFFGHWVCDDLPLALAAEGLGEPLAAAPPALPPRGGVPADPKSPHAHHPTCPLQVADCSG